MSTCRKVKCFCGWAARGTILRRYFAVDVLAINVSQLQLISHSSSRDPLWISNFKQHQSKEGSIVPSSARVLAWSSVCQSWLHVRHSVVTFERHSHIPGMEICISQYYSLSMVTSEPFFYMRLFATMMTSRACSVQCRAEKISGEFRSWPRIGRTDGVASVPLSISRTSSETQGRPTSEAENGEDGNGLDAAACLVTVDTMSDCLFPCHLP